VELGDNPLYANCTHREVQIPTQWSDSSVSVTVNRGSFSDSEQVYWFVIDESGIPSSGFFVDANGGNNNNGEDTAGRTDSLQPDKNFVSPAKGVLVTFGDNAVEVVIYDTAGNRVFSRSRSGAGNIVWDGRDSGGNKLESDVYLCKIKGSGGETVHHTIVVVN